MKTRAKAASLGIMMFAMAGLIGFSTPGAFAENVGVGPGGYQLNLSAKNWEKDDKVDCTKNNGHVIHIPLSGKFKILLSEGPFDVLDCNATKDKEAAFQLPNPIDLDGDGETDEGLGCEPDLTCVIGYGVYARALGGQGGTFVIGPTCGEADLIPDPLNTPEEYCTTDDLITLETPAGKGAGAKFQNVSKELLTICVDFLIYDTDGDGIPDEGDDKCDQRIALFDDLLGNYAWNFENDGSRNTQLRFVIETQYIS